MARAHGQLDGHILAFFVMTVAACEAAVGLSLIVLYYNQRRNVDADEINLLKG
jgi:NADH-quinone oxidoreductase subunit K